MHNIICLKHGTKFSPDYVNHLYHGVKRNTTLPFTFHCFTDDSNGLNPAIEIHSLPHVLPTWWNKLYLFSDEIDIEGRVLYIDLDTLVVGNIDEFLLVDEGFVVLRDYFHPDNDNMGSAIMSFETKKHTQIWETFIKDPKAVISALHPHGDQRWIQRQELDRLYWTDLLPDQTVSFKIHCRDGIPNNARLINYHGKPSIVESINTTTAAQGYVIPPTPWVADYWRKD